MNQVRDYILRNATDQGLTEIASALRTDTGVAASVRAVEARLKGAGFALDYLEIRNADDLTQSSLNASRAVVLVAARLGRARLIDNLVVTLKKSPD